MFPAIPALNYSSFNFQYRPPKVYPLKRTFSNIMHSSFKFFPPPPPPPPYEPHKNQQKERSYSAKPRKKVKTEQASNAKSIHHNINNEESQILLEKWKKGSFAPFYHWVQVNKADLKVEYREIEPKTKNKNPSFQCNVQLSFVFKCSHTVFTSNEFGLSKKQAKMKSFEKIVESLLRSGVITPALLKDKLYKKELPLKKNGEVNKIIQKNEKNEEVFPLEGPKLLLPICEQGKNQKKQVNKLVMQIRDKLKKDKFYEACALFCKIIDLKPPEWKELNYIWSYALLKHNLSYVQIILDLIAYKSRLKFFINYQEHQNEKKLNKKQEEHQQFEHVKEEFLKKYGSLRLFSENPFETVEFQEIDTHPHSENLGVFSSNMNNNQNTMNNHYSMLHQNMQKVPNMNMMSSNQQMNMFKGNIPFNSLNSMHCFNYYNDSMNKSVQIQQNIPPPPPPPPSNNDFFNMKERKNPLYRYFGYKIVDHLYDYLVYIPDLNFVLNVSELIYNKIHIDDEEMVNSSAACYYSHKKNMMTVELLESLSHSFSKHSKSPFEQLNNLTGNIQIVSNRFSEDILIFSPIDSKDVLETRITRRNSAEYTDNAYQIAKGEFVLIYGSFSMNNSNHLIQSSNPIMIIGRLWEITKDYKLRLYCMPSEIQRNMLMQKNQLWRVMKLVNGTSIEKASEALREVCKKINMNPNLLQIILTSPTQANKALMKQLAETPTNPNHNITLTHKSHLNHSQNLAIKSATSQLLTLIHGPPGTGKTKTAIEIALEWISQSPNTQILVCADSNIAVDLLHNEFLKLGVKSKRIGNNSEKSAEDRMKYVLEKSDPLKKKEITAEDIQSYQFFSAFKRTIQEAQVICCTCVGSKSDCLRNMKFQKIIIDEASQATETASLIPLVRDCQQLVLIGDHKQLAPVVISMYAQTKGMKISLFERLLRQGITPILLNVQYRMHPTLAIFPSYHFYNNGLENGVSDEQRKPILGFTWPNPFIRIAFIHAKGLEQTHSTSLQNVIEVDIVVHILLQVLKYKAIKPAEIGVITPYDAQKKKIKNEIINQARKFPTVFGLTAEQGFKVNKNCCLVDVDTVDGFQGMEKEFIIFSAVRSNNQGCLGFLNDVRRMNVMLTRAKRGLIIVGDIETLKNDSSWNDFIAWADANKIIIFYNKRR